MNLFATRIDQVIDFVEKRAEDNEYECIFLSLTQ